MTTTVAVGVDPRALGHAQLDDVAAELRVDDAAQHGHHVVRRWAASAVGTAQDSTGRSRVNSTEHDRTAEPPSRARGSTCSRRSATTPATRSTSSWPARPRRSPPPRSPRRSGCTPTPCAPTSSACARSACSTCVTDTRGAVGRPQHRYSLAADAPSLGLEPPAFPVLARMLLRLAASAAGARAPTPSRPAASRAPPRPLGSTGGHLRRGAHCQELAALGFDPESVDDDDGATDRLHPLPVPGAGRGQPRPGVQPAPGPGRGLRRRQRRRSRCVAFHDLVDRTPCQVEIATARR